MVKYRTILLAFKSYNLKGKHARASFNLLYNIYSYIFFNFETLKKKFLILTKTNVSIKTLKLPS